MKNLLIALFIVIAPSAFAQKLVVVPYVDDWRSLCDISKDPAVKESIKEISMALMDEGYRVSDFTRTARSARSQGVCGASSTKEAKEQFLKLSRADIYLEAEITPNKTSSGTYVTLSLVAYSTDGNEFISEQYGKSNKFITDNIAALTKRVLKKVMPELKSDIAHAADLIAENQNEDNYNLLPKEIKLESDVDLNIPSLGKENPNAVAVVIGNRDYKNKDVPPVDYAIHDARAMKEYLMKMYGFKEGNIILVEDATQASFNALFGTPSNHKAKLYNYLKPNRLSDVFVFYSGHGAPDPESKEGYFVPVDCDPSLVKFNGYAVKTLYANLAKMDYRTLTVVIDACFSGSSDKGMLIKNVSPVFINTRDKVMTDEMAAVLTSAASEQVSSWYPEKNHSLFTYYYLKGLRGEANANKDRWLTLGEMRAYLKEHVPYMARRLNNREQDPQITGDDIKVLMEY